MPLSSAFVLASQSDLGLGLAAVVVIGVGAQWLASKIYVPSVLLLLLGGVIAGPVLEIVNTDELLGPLLFPAVSLAVGILLFEGGLSLQFAELEKHGRGPILRLVTIGVLVTWVIGFLAAWSLLDVTRNGAILLGAILTVSGPTVVLPLLRFARVREPVNGILRWEGIFIDPVGATLAIVVLDAVIQDEGSFAGAQRIFTTSVAGIAAGMIGALVLVLLFRFHLVPDHLHNPLVLALVVAAFAGADLVRAEAGLFATTVMGVALANQRVAPIAHIREFEENLGQLILAGLFVVLGARIDLDQLTEFLPEAIGLTLVLFFIARPAAVYISTVGSGLSFVERAYLACLAPRGIVAASVSALFAIELEAAGQPVDALVPVTFIVIVGTVILSTISAKLGAQKFRVARPAARGVAFIGGPPWAIALAGRLVDLDVPALVVTSDPFEASDTSKAGVLTYTGRLDSKDLALALDSVGVSQVVALSRFQELNSLAIHRATEAVGRAHVFYLPPTDHESDISAAQDAVIARRPFGGSCTRDSIDAMVDSNAEIISMNSINWDPGRLVDAIPLIRVDADGIPTVYITKQTKAPADGDTRFYLAFPPPESVADPGPEDAMPDFVSEFIDENPRSSNSPE
jgi:NhaP-type Na+/H+ or K+/H+ antiporter